VRGGFQVEVPNRVGKEMRVLPDFVLERVIEALRGLALDPFPQGVKSYKTVQNTVCGLVITVFCKR
jgi:hypothetical protein